MKILIAGGTGFIGQALKARLLAGGHHVIVLTRNSGNQQKQEENCIVEQWNGLTLGDWARHVDGADAVINLSGEMIAGKRWSPEQKRKLRESRVNSTLAIISAIRQAVRKPATLVNASAVGYYGNVPEGEVDETTPPGNDFLADVCIEWERTALLASEMNVRVVLPRFGVVLDTKHGALPKLMLPFKLWAGGWLGSGKQWFPWIHLDDVTGSILYALHNQQVEGVYNCTAPEPVRLKEFCRVLGATIGRPSWAPAPAFVLKLALGEMSTLVLSGQRAIPKKLTDSGYRFHYPSLEQALHALLKK